MSCKVRRETLLVDKLQGPAGPPPPTMCMDTTPDYWNATQCHDIYLARHATVAEAAAELRRRAPITPAAEDRERVALFGIDAQVGFCHRDASLFVPGAPGDIERAIEFLYRNLERITTVVLSQDTHQAFQIFHPAFWVDGDGRHAPPMTVISAADVESGRWRPAMDPALALTYCRALEAQGHYQLTIWPFHAMLGAIDHAIVPPLFEAALLHALTRDAPTRFETKGSHPLTENYSVLEPEVKSLGELNVGSFNRSLFDLLDSHDRIYVFGEASSHCVLATLTSLQRAMSAQNPASLAKLYVLADCMSPVPAITGPDGDPIDGLDFPRIASSALAELAEAGVNVVTSTDLW